MACTLELVRAARRDPGIEKALAREYRFTWRGRSRRRPARGHPRRGHRQGPQPGLARRHGQPAARGCRGHAGAARRRTSSTLPPQGGRHGDRLHRTGQHGRADGPQPRRAPATTSPASTPAGVTVEGVAPRRLAPPRPPRGRDAVITMLPNGAILRARLRRDRPGRRAPAPPSSTARPSTSRAPAPPPRKPRPPACSPVDAPVSGGTAGAAAGTLTFMAGGSRRRLREGPPALRNHGLARRPLRRRRRRPGGEDLQQHDPRHLDDRRLRGLRAGRRSSASTAHALYDVVSTSSGSCWSVTTLLPGARRRPDLARRPRLPPRLRRRADAEGPDLSQQAADRGRRRHAARRPRRRALRRLRRRRAAAAATSPPMLPWLRERPRGG